MLEEGCIVEQGTHRELIAKNGAYAGMVKAYEISGVQVEGQNSEVDIEGLRPSTFDIQPINNRQSKIADQKSSILFRLLSFLNGSWNWVALSVLLSTLTIGSSVALIGTSSWLISTAALHPSVADLGVSVVGVRFFGIARGLFRYL